MGGLRLRIARYRIEGKSVMGRLADGRLHPFPSDSLDVLTEFGTPLSLEGAVPLRPCRPEKIVGVGLNYRDHARERGKPIPAEPLIFLKPPTAALGPGAPILLPRGAGRIDHEAELAIVIGRTARDLPESSAPEAILGYTCFNDVTAREIQERDGQFTRAKGFDTFAPFGPWIETDLDPSNLEVIARVNRSTRQASRTRELIFSPATLVAFISRVMTLRPGDIIATGTPAGIGPLAPGDLVEIVIEGIGTLANPVLGSF